MIFFLKSKTKELKADLKQMKSLINEYDKYVLQNQIRMNNKEVVTQDDLKKDAVTRLKTIIEYCTAKALVYLEEKSFRQNKEKYEKILEKLLKFIETIDLAEKQNKIIEVRNG